MKKYFVVSDIHGYFDIFHNALLKAGFEEENPEHILIVCGDIFDRGKQPLEVYNYLKDFPKERKILIRGNHEFLLRHLVEREEPLTHDLHNKTYHTLYNIIGKDYDEEEAKRRIEYIKHVYDGAYNNKEFLEKDSQKREKFNHKLFHNRTLQRILKWIDSDEWVPFYELGPYIFVHSFLPTQVCANDPSWQTHCIIEKWRECDPKSTVGNRQWEQATWECPFKLYKDNIESPELKDKILVCGHWHTADFWNNLENKNYSVYDFNPIFISKNYPGLIGIDACTAATKGCNVLVINEDMSLEPHNHKEYTIETVMEEKNNE